MLEQVECGKMRQLMLLLPHRVPRRASTYAAVVSGVWWMVRNPQHSVIMACHTARLAEHFGRGVRGLLEEHGGLLGVACQPDSRAAETFQRSIRGANFSASA